MTKAKAHKDILTTIKYLDQITKGTAKSPDLSLISLIKYLTAVLQLVKHGSSDRIKLSIDNTGSRTSVLLLEDSRWVFHHLLQHSQKRIEKNTFKRYLKTSREFLTASCVSLDLKTQLIDLENEHLKLYETNALQEHGESVEEVECRLLVCFDVLEDKSLTESDERFSGTRNCAAKYLDKLINWFVYRGHLIQAQVYLQSLASNNTNTAITGLLIPALINHASSYGLISKEEQNSILGDYEYALKDDTKKELQAQIDSSPSDIQIHALSVSNGKLSKKICSDRSIGTVILFSLSCECLCDEKTTLELENKHLISFEPINSFWEDPMFRAMSSWNLGGISWAFYCDTDPAVDSKYTHIRLGIPDCYHPDITLNEDGYEEIDFTEEVARRGRDFYPIKDYVITFLRDNHDSFKKIIQINKKDINANLFSNLIVKYNDASNGQTLYQKVIAGTIPGAYSNSITKYLQQCAEANVKDSYISIKTLLTNTPVTSNASLQKLVIKFIELFVKHNIELSGDHIYCWDDTGGALIPKKEPKLQPYIYNHLKPHFGFLGMQIVRESYAADGSLDFLVSYNNEKHEKFTVCIELKLAHSQKIEDGLSKQLPKYMEDMQSKYGIYIYMWFKGDNFTEPKAFSQIKDLDNHLVSLNKNPRINTLGIDCTKPPTPSKL